MRLFTQVSSTYNVPQAKKAIIKSISAAFGVFIFGFVAMYILYRIWLKENPSSPLPGLFYYKAAAIGDPICLPLIIGVLFFHNCSQKSIRSTAGKASIVLGVIAFIVGVSIQAKWLINDNTGLNWSLPEPHRFNLGGWYHAIFFVVIITGIIFLFTEYTWYSRTRPTIITDFILYFSVIFFALLHYIDDYINRDKPISSLSFAACLFVAICCIFKAIQNFRLKKHSAVSYASIIVSGALAYLISLTQI